MELSRKATVQIIFVLCILLASFGTQPRAENEVFTFAVTADSRGNDPESPVNLTVLNHVFENMNTFVPEFCLFPGDLVFGGVVDNQNFKSQLQIWIGAASSFKSPIYPAPGNHEMRHWPNRDKAWNEMFPGLPSNGPVEGPKAGNYFFDYRGSRFISVLSDDEDGHMAVDQKWLDQVLESSTGFKHIFVMSHHPMQQLGGSGGEFWQSLRRHRVDAYFCGHWHLYNRSQPEGAGTWQIILGTAGAPPLAYVPFWMMNGTTKADKYGFGIIKVSDTFVDVAFYGGSKGQEEHPKPLDHFIISAASQDTEPYSDLKDKLLELLTRPSSLHRERKDNHQTPLPSGG